MDPHIFADPNPDPGSQNLADPTDSDPDPNHCTKAISENVKDVVFTTFKLYSLFLYLETRMTLFI